LGLVFVEAELRQRRGVETNRPHSATAGHRLPKTETSTTSAMNPTTTRPSVRPASISIQNGRLSEVGHSACGGQSGEVARTYCKLSTGAGLDRHRFRQGN
jgi:hypothetical protein